MAVEVTAAAAMAPAAVATEVEAATVAVAGTRVAAVEATEMASTKVAGAVAEETSALATATAMVVAPCAADPEATPSVALAPMVSSSCRGLRTRLLGAAWPVLQQAVCFFQAMAVRVAATGDRRPVRSVF